MKKSGMSVGSGRASIRAGSAFSGQCAATHIYTRANMHVSYTYQHGLSSPKVKSRSRGGTAEVKVFPDESQACPNDRGSWAA